MIRNIFRLFLVFIAAVFIRQVVVLLMRAFSQMAGGTPGSPPPAPREQSRGELKKDPVCGTFVAVASSIKRNVDGEVIHFCSTACRDKYQAA
jgi:YHS domain-containing protein